MIDLTTLDPDRVEPAREQARARVRRAEPELVALSHRIHAHPEVGFEEHRAAAWVGEQLAATGFAVEAGVGDLPTALSASYGSGSLTVALCAEYDALPGVGHACGHNVIAAAAVAGALGLAAVADDLDLTVKVIGCPAEENGGGKILLLQRGAFDGVHLAMMVHPSPDEDPAPRTLAVSDLAVSYTGRSAHAAAYPERGVNAADALTVAQVALGLLRQHIRADERIHGITLDGGDAPNVIPAHSSAAYYLRAPSLELLHALEPRVRGCFEAGALATGCTVEMHEICPPYSEFEPDADLVRLYARNARRLDRPEPRPRRALGSTDMANVSLALPAIQPMIAIECGDASNHQPEFAAHCAGPSADRAVVEGGIAMAWTAIDAAADPAVRSRLLASARLPVAPRS